MDDLFTETTGATDTATDAVDTAVVGEAAEPNKYNVYGVIEGMLMKGQAKRVLTFSLKRRNGQTLACVAFGKTIEAIVKDGFRNGAEVKVWGYYVDQTFQGRDGIDRQRTEFRLLKVSAPLPPKEAAEGGEGASAEAPAEAGAVETGAPADAPAEDEIFA